MRAQGFETLLATRRLLSVERRLQKQSRNLTDMSAYHDFAIRFIFKLPNCERFYGHIKLTEIIVFTVSESVLVGMSV